MKTFVKMILPVAAFVLAGAGAVGSHVSGENAEKAVMTGYVHNPTSTNCLAVEVNCQTASTGILCKAFTPERQVYRYGNLQNCDVPLWKPQVS